MQIVESIGNTVQELGKSIGEFFSSGKTAEDQLMKVVTVALAILAVCAIYFVVSSVISGVVSVIGVPATAVMTLVAVGFFYYSVQ